MPIATLGGMGLLHGQDYLVLAFAFVSFAILCVPLLAKRNYLIVEPYSIIFLVLYLGIPLKLVWVLAFRDTARLQSVLLGARVEDFLYPCVIVILALTSLSAGYLSGRSFGKTIRPFRLPNRTWNTKLLFLVCGVAIAISTVVFFLYAQRIGLGGGGPISAKRFEKVADGPMQRGSLSYYRWAIGFTQVVSYILLAWILTSKLGRRAKAVALIVFAVPTTLALVGPFINSSRYPIVFFLIESLVIVYCLKKNMLKTRMLAIQAALVVAVAILFVGILALRRDGHAAGSGIEFIKPFPILEHAIGDPYLADVTKTVHIIRAVPDRVPYQTGRTYAALFVAPIPRDYWPAKPAIGAGPFVGEHIYGLKHTGIPPGLIGESFLNFGLAGVAIIPFFYGWLVRWSYEKLIPSLRTAVGAVCFAICFRFYVAALGMDVAVGMVQCLAELLPALTIMLIVQYRRPYVGSYGYDTSMAQA